MKVSAQEEYGLRCLIRIAQAEEGHSLTIPEIANTEGLSIPYVGKLLAVLRQAGLIESVRGRSGGYRLAVSPSEISLGSIMLVLGEPLFDDPGYCQRHAGSETDGNCVHHGSCTLRALWGTLEQWMRRAFDQVTLADLLHNEGYLGDVLRSRLAAALLEPASQRIALTAFNSELVGIKDPK
jgi:Rrf2 family protein